jgi:hypothetical protein
VPLKIHTTKSLRKFPNVTFLLQNAYTLEASKARVEASSADNIYIIVSHTNRKQYGDHKMFF